MAGGRQVFSEKHTSFHHGPPTPLGGFVDAGLRFMKDMVREGETRSESLGEGVHGPLCCSTYSACSIHFAKLMDEQDFSSDSERTLALT